MPGYTVPLAIPFPVSGDTTRAAMQAIPQAQAEKINDLIAALAAVAPTPYTSLALGAGFAGVVEYARRAGIVVVNYRVTKANIGADEVLATLPLGFRPAGNTEAVRSTGHHAGNLRLAYIGVGTGFIRAETAYTDGMRGSFAFAV